VQPSRRAHGKPLDVANIRQDIERFEYYDRIHPDDLSIDNTLIAAAEVAEMIRAKLRRQPMTPFSMRNEGVVLRDFVEEDRAAFVALADDPSMYEFMAFRYANREEAATAFERLLHHPSREADPRKRFYVAVLDASERFVGTSGFDIYRDGTGEFGWYLSPSAWGRGLATAATALWLGFGFEQLELPTVWATCDPDNGASRRVLEKSGLRLQTGTETIATWRGPRPRLRFVMDRAAWDDLQSGDHS